MISVEKLLKRVAQALVDDEFVLFDRSFHINSLNDGLSAIAMVQPQITSQTKDINLVAGQWKVNLPADGFKLLSVNHCGGYGIEPVGLEQLNHLHPDWRRQTDERPENWIVNPNDEKSFFVFPAPESAVSIEIDYSRNMSVSDETESIDINEMYEQLLFDFMMYRAYSRDGQAEAQQAKAASHFQVFQSMLGVKQ